MLQGAKIRTAMTLVELLVVMAIIVIFTAMTAAFYPANQADRELSRFSNTVQSALLSARNRAKAERLPTGIRFYDSDANGKVDSVVLIQKPLPTLGTSFGNIPIMEFPTGSGNFYADLTGFPQDPLTGKILITGGEFLQLPSGDVGQITLITLPAVPPNGLPAPYYVVPAVFYQNQMSSGFSNNLLSAPSVYTIFRNPIELSGDTPFELSNTIEIQMPTTVGSPLDSFTSAYCFLASLPPPTNRVYPSYMDIIFNPDGSLNNSTSEVYLHLHNFEALAGDYSRDAILAVRKMSGSIGVYEVGQPIDFANPTDILKHNPNMFAKDPRNKGI